MNYELRLKATLQQPFALQAELQCGEGELLALLGPSGSGKSTVLRLIAGLQYPQSGSIELGSNVWFDQRVRLAPQQRRVGYVPQNYGLFPHMSALDNVCAGLHHLPRHEQTRQARKWLERVHLSDYSKRKPAELSGGQQQRVALARALAAEPSILLLDEPFSALDSITRESLYVQLAELKAGLKIPIIMVTHDLNEASMLADRVALIDNGRILQVGSPANVTRQPVSRRVAELVGLHNIFRSEVVVQDNAMVTLKLGRHLLKVPTKQAVLPGGYLEWVLPTDALEITTQDEIAALHGFVSNILRLGNLVRLFVRVDGGTEVFQLQAASHHHFELDQPLAFKLDVSKVHILPMV
ncbi:ABC transporter ATP-binding protein [Methylobacillus caricis]|uniref:ABC transporter ATP-binding protein n=1 Tax=Methylobacillus caricis TaxID=1971611 RepID=UPI001CFFD247|nr:ABC transporter ATP-binding protein [Methylobacillus caricis]MCB5187527.1 ABC transporter ATP-binding protein [Methylobacillus caricis]